MKKQLLSLGLLLGLGLTGVANATVCTVDEVPAATLLLPYFEVDTTHANGVSTTFSVNNANAAAVLAHVTIWSDLSSPVFDFNIYLTGYDVQVINLSDLIVGGIIPSTATAGQDPSDTISPRGIFSQDINYASCNGILPSPTPLPAVFTTFLQDALTGRPAALIGNKCVGRKLGDRIARGYVTVDTVSNCTLRFPTDVGYFAPGGTGDATNQNFLWGDYAITNHRAKTGFGGPLVHIEADANNPNTSTSGNYTFYGRYVNWTAADNREPLSTRFGARFSNMGTVSNTDLIVWRDSKVSQTPFNCPAGVGNPSWYPLGQEQIAIFDEQEQPAIPGGITPFGAEAQRTTVGSAALPVPFTSGWLLMNLNTTVAAAGANPPVDPAAAQAYVTAVTTSDSGLFTIGNPAVQFDNACNADHTTL